MKKMYKYFYGRKGVNFFNLVFKKVNIPELRVRSQYVQKATPISADMIRKNGISNKELDQLLIENN